ncbi:MAG: hypothetical protein WCL23_00895 [Candidatus Moraniibacteriota bacterium]
MFFKFPEIETDSVWSPFSYEISSTESGRLMTIEIFKSRVLDNLFEIGAVFIARSGIEFMSEINLGFTFYPIRAVGCEKKIRLVVLKKFLLTIDRQLIRRNGVFSKGSELYTI